MTKRESVTVDVYGCTDTGAIRELNEDAFLIGSLDDGETVPADSIAQFTGPRGPLMLVCDGMGGMAGGEVASQLAVETIWAEMREAQATTDRDVLARILRRAVRKANGRLRQRAREKPELRGMGTTVSCAALAGSTVVVAQVGDSRAYLLRGDEMVQITRDQSVVSALISAGKLTESEARFSHQRSMVLQAVGAEEDVAVSLSIAELCRGDRLLLCSDGLHGCVVDAAITAAIVDRAADDAGARLLERAHQAGAPDNITAIVADFTGETLDEAEAGEAVHFAELDPSEEGPEAVTSTSRVARRLAARAGILDEKPMVGVPATGMYTAIGHDGLRASVEGSTVGPAQARLLRHTRLGLIAWVVAIVALLVGLVLILFM